MKKVIYGLGLALASLNMASPAWAETSTASATVAVSLAQRTEIALDRNDKSVSRGSKTVIIFDKTDFEDRGKDGNPIQMYAPYVTESSAGQNWHILDILSTTGLNITAQVTGTVGGKPLADIMQFYCDKFYGFDPQQNFDPCSSDQGDAKWHYLNGWTWQSSSPFVGTTPLNYRLLILGVNAGQYAGQITYTATSI